MAATKAIPNKIQQERTRSAIQTTQLVKRLQFYALGEEDPASGALVELDSGNLKAIEILLRKSLPDLSAVVISGDADNPVKIEDVSGASGKLLDALALIAKRS